MARYDMPISEFLYRVLPDSDFHPFGVARYAFKPTFDPACGDDE